MKFSYQKLWSYKVWIQCMFYWKIIEDASMVYTLINPSTSTSMFHYKNINVSLQKHRWSVDAKEILQKIGASGRSETISLTIPAVGANLVWKSKGIFGFFFSSFRIWTKNFGSNGTLFSCFNYASLFYFYFKNSNRWFKPINVLEDQVLYFVWNYLLFF